MTLYKNKYRSETFRIRNWDYGAPGYYYVTICTKDREHYFGKVVLCPSGENDNYNIPGTRPWDGPRGGVEGTHNDAALPPAAHPAHGSTTPMSQFPQAMTRLTKIGRIAYQNRVNIPTHFPFVVLDEFVIMPNHIHGILCFYKPGYRDRNVNTFGPLSENLASVRRNSKGATKKYATLNDIDFCWQARYHDDVITSGRELDNIRIHPKQS